jgi:hypothetical protein
VLLAAMKPPDGVPQPLAGEQSFVEKAENCGEY